MAKLERVSEEEAAALRTPKNDREALVAGYRALLEEAPDGSFLKLELEEGDKSADVLRALRRAAALAGKIITAKRRRGDTPPGILYFQVFQKPSLEVEE